MDKQKRAWIMYDWANSAYVLIITTVIFAMYFKLFAEGMYVDLGHSEDFAAQKSTSIWAYMTTITTLILAVVSPIIGTVADVWGFKKRLFAFFVFLGVLFTLFLGIFSYTSLLPMAIVYIVSSVGFGAANIIYDAFLVDVSSEKDRNKVSAYGYAIGYLGSLIPFVLGIIFLGKAEDFGLTTTAATRIIFVVTAMWWGLFTIPFLKNVKQVYGRELKKDEKIIKSSFSELFDTLKGIRAYKSAFIFLLAYFFYIDGVHTIIYLATPIGLDLGISSETLLIVLVVTQLVGLPSAIIYGILGEKFGTRIMLIIGIVTYIFTTAFAMLFLEGTRDFYILGVLIGTAQGGVQALSRSEFSKRIPAEKSNEFFGFYSIFGKFAAVGGPLLFNLGLYITGSTQLAIGFLQILFVTGLVLLLVSNRKNTSI